MKRTAFAVGIISISIIAYQIALMRILSISQFHHFAYMIISVALLGFGCSGTFLSVFRKKALQFSNEITFLSLVFCSISMITGLYVFNHIDINPFLILWNITEGLPLLVFYLLIFIPFFFGAVAICLAFMKFSENINIIYFSNLIGSAIGGIIVLGLFFIFEPHEIPGMLALLPLLAAAVVYLRKKYSFILILFNVLFIAFNFVYNKGLNISEYKSFSKTLLLPDTKIINEKVSPLGKLTVLSSPALRYSPGLSLSFTGDIPTPLGLFSDGEWVGAISYTTNNEIDYLNYTTSAIPYLLKQNARVLVIGSGTGSELQLALQNNAAEITGIELNPQVIDLLQQNSSILNNEKIKIIIGEGRGVLSQLENKYGIITIPILEGFASSAAGMYSLHENYLFTVESFAAIIDHLKDDGIFAVTSWINTPPRHSLKLFATLVQALENDGINQPENNIAAIRSWGTVTIFVKKDKITSDDVLKIKLFCDEKYFDAFYYPGISEDESNIYNVLERDVYFQSAQNILFSDRKQFYADYTFNIEPPTDDKPYFSHFLKPTNLFSLIETEGKESVTLYEYGYVILIVTLMQIIVLAIILILVPAFFLKKEAVQSGVKLKTLLYFSGLGIGYMFVEIVLIQKYILFLSHPIYSVSVVIASLLFFSGIGSYYSIKLSKLSGSSLIIIINLIIALSLIFFTALPTIFISLIHLNITLKYVISFLLIAPIAFFMGMPFPIGIKKLAVNYSSLIPWAWSINGFLSVISAVLVPIIAMESGFTVVVIFAVLGYIISLISRIK
jgi:hypothetical protein